MPTVGLRIQSPPSSSADAAHYLLRKQTREYRCPIILICTLQHASVGALLRRSVCGRRKPAEFVKGVRRTHVFADEKNPIICALVRQTNVCNYNACVWHYIVIGTTRVTTSSLPRRTATSGRRWIVRRIMVAVNDIIIIIDNNNIIDKIKSVFISAVFPYAFVPAKLVKIRRNLQLRYFFHVQDSFLIRTKILEAKNPSWMCESQNVNGSITSA